MTDERINLTEPEPDGIADNAVRESCLGWCSILCANGVPPERRLELLQLATDQTQIWCDGATGSCGLATEGAKCAVSAAARQVAAEMLTSSGQ